MPVTLTWTGHATFLIDTGAGTILVDPFFDECPTASMKAADVACDLILLTHGHFDHVADAAAIAKRTGAKVCCAFEIANWLGKQGVANLQPMNHGGTVAVPGGTATMELAFHSSSLPDGSYGGNPAGWLERNHRILQHYQALVRTAATLDALVEQEEENRWWAGL